MFKSGPSEQEVDILSEKHKKMFFASRFRFLQAVNGIRPGCLHGLLAPTSMGKSTITRSIICDTAESAKVGIILSEETPIEYSAGFKSQKENVSWENVKFLIEDDVCKVFPAKSEQLDAIVYFAIENDIKVLFWDNITTGSILGDSVRPNQMAELLSDLKSKLFQNDIALFFVAHTNKGVKTEQNFQFQGEDVRGSAQYFMKADYFFNLQTKTKNDEKISFIKIAKHRFHQPKSNHFVLEFIVNKYTRDIAVPYSKIQEIFEKENKNEKNSKKDRIYSNRNF